MMDSKKHLSDRGAAILLSGLCSLIYFTSYISRYTLTVCIAEITGKGVLTETEVGLATMLLFIFYGAGQLLSGYLGDKIPPQRVICIGLIGAACSNALLPFLIGYPIVAAILWGIHGLFQAMFWPPIVKLLATRLKPKYYSNGSLAVSIASHSANIMLYLLAPLCIGTFGDWRILFLIAIAMCVFSFVLFLVVYRYFTKHYPAVELETVSANAEAPKESDGKKKGQNRSLFAAIASSGALVLLIGIILQGALKEGVTAWLPSYICNVDGSDSSDAILKSVAIPIASIICLYSVSFLYKKLKLNEALGAALMFGIGTLASAVIFFVPSLPPILTIICAALLTGTMHGVNLFLIAYLPARFNSYGKTSTVSGITNSCAYIGCSVYTYGVAVLSTELGWTATALSWLIIPAVGLVSCVAAYPLWKKFIRSSEK